MRKKKIKSLKTLTGHQRFKTMLSCFVKCRKNTESKNQNVVKKKLGKSMFISKCVVCDSKESKLIKE